MIVNECPWRSDWNGIIGYANSSSSCWVVIRWSIPSNNGSSDIMDVSPFSPLTPSILAISPIELFRQRGMIDKVDG
jgi:hypothetical protein